MKDFTTGEKKECLNFLRDKELIIELADEKMCSLFNYCEETWDYFGHISNSIIEISDQSNIELVSKAAEELYCNLKCKHLEIRFVSKLPMSVIISVTDAFTKKCPTSVYLTVGAGIENFSNDEFEYWLSQNENIKMIYHYGADKDQDVFMFNKIYYSRIGIVATQSCGHIGIENFRISYPLYTESLHHNTCLNRKISIDAEGNIKNCPSMKESYGNICDTTLAEAINEPGFKQCWDIKKDEITKCKDCEFRHICTDCRAYLDDPEDMYSAPLKCGYDPYTCEWEEWSAHPLKQQTIDHYHMRKIL